VAGQLTINYAGAVTPVSRSIGMRLWSFHRR